MNFGAPFSTTLASRPIVQNPFMRWLAEAQNPNIEVVKPNVATRMNMPKPSAPQGPNVGRMTRQGFLEENNPTPNMGVQVPALDPNMMYQDPRMILHQGVRNSY